MKTAFLALALLGTSLLPHAAASAGEIVTSDGTTHVLNRQPALPPVTLQLEELWRAGGEDNADGLIFGIPVEAVADEAGRVYLADQQLCQVFVFETDGTLAGTLSREGDGPGEVRGPVDLVHLPDGTFGLAEFFPGKITKLTVDDLPAGLIEVDVAPGETGGFTMQTMAEAKGGHLLIAGSRSVPKDRILERIHFLAALDPDGVQTVRYMEQRSEIQRPHSVVHEDDFLPSLPPGQRPGPGRPRLHALRARAVPGRGVQRRRHHGPRDRTAGLPDLAAHRPGHQARPGPVRVLGRRQPRHLARVRPGEDRAQPSTPCTSTARAASGSSTAAATATSPRARS